MKVNKIFFLTIISLSLTLSQNQCGLARGGGGGFGGGGGHFGGMGAGASRGDFGRGDYGRGDFGADHLDSGYYGHDEMASDRPDAFSRPYGGFNDAGVDRGLGDRDALDRQLDNDLSRPGDYVRNWNGTGRDALGSLPTDGGFGRMSGANNFAGRGNLGNNRTQPVASESLAGRGDNVRNNWNNLARNWDRYPYWNNWGYGDWWGGAGWGGIADFWDYPVSEEPVYYDYGNNITYQGDTVYYGSQPLESAGTYYNQAEALASTYPDVTYPVVTQPITNGQNQTQLATTTAPKLPSNFSKDWKPLGVYSLVQGEQSDTTQLFQLAVNKQGAVRGNYYNILTSETKPVKGSVDKKNMRVAWTIGDNKAVVYDTGLSNLLKNQSSILVHFNKDHTEQWTMVKLNQPDQSNKAASPRPLS